MASIFDPIRFGELVLPRQMAISPRTRARCGSDRGYLHYRLPDQEARA
jgi:hypothetical protein